MGKLGVSLNEAIEMSLSVLDGYFSKQIPSLCLV